MRLPSWLSLPRSSFFYQLAVIFTFGILCLSLVSSVAISELTYQIVREKLLAQGSQATKTFAEQSTLALLYSSTDNAEGPIRSTLAFPDVRGVAVYTAEHALLAARGEAAAPEGDDPQWPLQVQLEQETDQAWYFVAPVFARRASAEDASPFAAQPQAEELVGFVRLGMGKETLTAMQESLLRTNLGASGAFALLFLVFLLAITRRLTTPLKHLAGMMERASAGAKNLRANLRGSRDIVHMEMAFNNMMDVLEMRERQLEKARDAALQTARLKGEFAANVSHELRTPLNAVLGMLELLEHMGLSAEQYEYVTVARNAGDSLLLLIEDILDFSRIEAGMMKLHPEDFALHEVLDEVVALLGGQARRKELDLDYLLDGDLPLAVQGDRSRIRQVLVNLVGNAIKFTPKGGIEIRVRPAGNNKEKHLLRFEVADTGIGIPAEAQKSIFDAFVQADGSITRTFGGFGLGLAICRQLVDLMGGEIGVASEPGKGSRFWFAVPLKALEAAGSRSRVPAEVADLNVLVVTDNPKTRQFLSQLLRRWEIRHDVAEEGNSALELLRAAARGDTPFQFAVFDQCDPAGGVSDVVRLMARDPGLSRTRVILLSNAPQEGLGQTQTERPANVVGCLNRPLQASTLYDLLITHGRGSGKAHAGAPPAEPALYLDRRILLVEDNRTNQQVALGMLERIGCRSDVAVNGREALEWLKRRPYDLVLMDCHMPEMDGFEATRQIRALENRRVARIPIVALTAHVQKSEIDQCQAAGMDDYLAKPVRLAALRKKLQYWLGLGDGMGTSRSGAADGWADDDGLVPLDGRVLRQLREEIGDAMSTMIRVFLEDFPAQLQTLRQTGTAGEADALRCLAHALKGAGRNLGAGPFAEIAARMENLAGGGSTQEALALTDALAEEFQRIKPALERQVTSEPGQEAPVETHRLPLVLVADDDRAMRSALHDVLRKDGYRIEQAATGAQALAICRRKMPDLVLLDAMMPKMDGFAVCSHIRRHPDGTHTPVLIVTALDDESSIDRAFAAGATDYIPKPVHFAVLRQRVSRLLDARRAEEHLNYLTYHDVLTGLPNRTLFTERLEAIIKQGGLTPGMHALLFLDLDRFKLTNDTMGHEIGDLLLNAVAERIQRSVRSGDLVSRLGGDEFTIFLQNIGSLQIVSVVAEKICGAVSEPFVFGERELYISSSIGISVYPSDGADGGMLLKHADTAMYRAKERGNTHCFYEESMELAVSTKLHLERDLRRALDRNEFILHYQPQIDIGSGEISGIEALIRWQHPEKGMIPPLQFIPLAEEIGLIEAIGEWALRNACVQNKTWQLAGLPRIPVAVNLSARELEKDDIAANILAILSETGLEPQYLELEITESAVMRDPDKTRHILNTLKAKSIHISIDDFGTGYSSLSQLKYFPFDKLKIDKSFVCDSATDSDNTAIMLSIIAIAKNMNLKVIAEGVETREQFEYLQKNGCDEIQGYYFSRPLPADELVPLLKKLPNERASLVF